MAVLPVMPPCVSPLLPRLLGLIIMVSPPAASALPAARRRVAVKSCVASSACKAPQKWRSAAGNDHLLHLTGEALEECPSTGGQIVCLACKAVLKVSHIGAC